MLTESNSKLKVQALLDICKILNKKIKGIHKDIVNKLFEECDNALDSALLCDSGFINAYYKKHNSTHLNIIIQTTQGKKLLLSIGLIVHDKLTPIA